jgi:hypothetical protein
MEEMVRIRPAVLLGLATLLFGCAEQPTGLYDGLLESPGSASRAYGYSPGYLGPDYYGSDVFIGGGGYWVNGKNRDPYWYQRHRGWDRDRVGQQHERLRHENEAQARVQAWQQLQQQKAQAAVQQQQAAQQQAALAAQAQAALQQQRAAAQAAQAQAVQQVYQQRAQAVQQMYQQRAQMLAAQQQALAAARARGLAQ